MKQNVVATCRAARAGALLLAVWGAVALSGCANAEKRVRHDLPRLYSTDDFQFRQTMSSLLGPALIAGNRIEPLQNGDAIFPAMLDAIASAQSTICFESYIYWSGAVGDRFAAALAERAQAGVTVNVLLDWVGSGKIDQKAIEKMEKAGVTFARYHALHWYHLGRLNNRTHRKLLIIDGKTGFTGGVGIADNWLGDAQDPEHWRDSHYRVTGPVVNQMQAVFLDNWIKATGNVLHGEKYFPQLIAKGEGLAQMFSSSPSGGAESMKLMYLLAITAAQRSISLSSAYFVPDPHTREALIAAQKRGVRVRIITPGRYIDTQVVRHASHARWGELLEAGIEIYEYQPTMFHCKLMVVDDLFSSVGSTNFDPRSFGLNDEANLNILDADFARQQQGVFERDLASSRKVTLEAWTSRPWTEKAIEQLASLFSSQL